MSTQENTSDASMPALPAHPNTTPQVVMPAAPREKGSRGAGTTFLLVFGGVAAVMFAVACFAFVGILFLGVNTRYAAAHAAATALEEQSRAAPAPAAPAQTPR